MLSAPIYESLPYLYLGAGVASFNLEASPIVFVSGTLFLIAGGMVLQMRREFRRTWKKHTPRLQWVAYSGVRTVRR